MPAYFENGVFTDNLPAWHGLGVVVPDSTLTKERIFEIVPELASPVLQGTLYVTAVTDDGEVIVGDTEKFYGAIRQCDAKVLGAGMGAGYTIPQPAELFEFAEDIVEQGGLWKTAGTLEDGAVIWGMLEIPDAAKIAGEEYQRNLYVATSYNRGMATRCGTNSTRIQCSNTLAAADRESQRTFSIRHTANWRERMQDAKAALKLAYDHHEHLRVLGEALAAEKCSKRELAAWLRTLVPYTPESEVSDVVRRNIDAKRFDIGEVVWKSPNLDHLRGTLWGAVQGVTEFEQHYAVPGRKAETKLRTVLDNDLPLTKATLGWAREKAGVS